MQRDCKLNCLVLCLKTACNFIRCEGAVERVSARSYGKLSVRNESTARLLRAIYFDDHLIRESAIIVGLSCYL